MPEQNASPDLTVSILRCQSCGARDPGPRDLCPACHAATLAPEDVAGAGTLVASTIIRRPPAKFKADGAYGIAVIELDAGVRVVGRVDDQAEPWRPGERVVVIAKHRGYDLFGRSTS